MVTAQEKREIDASLLALKGAIFDMPAEAQLQIADVVEEIRKVVKAAGDAGTIALVFASLQMSQEQG